MKQFLPGRAELLIFAILALVSAAIVSGVPDSRAAGLSMFAFPIFVFAAVWGLWKSGRLRGVDE